MFPCQLLLGYQHFLSNRMASGYICAFNAVRSCGAQLLMEHSYPFSHYWLIYVWDPPGLRETIRDLACVCEHSVANKENRPALWKHLSNTRNRNLSTQTKDLLLIALQMSSDMDVNTVPWVNSSNMWTRGRACIISWKIIKHKSGAPAVTAVLVYLFLLFAQEPHPSTDTQNREEPKTFSPKQHTRRWMDVLFLWLIKSAPLDGEQVMSCLQRNLDISCFILIFIRQ